MLLVFAAFLLAVTANVDTEFRHFFETRRIKGGKPYNSCAHGERDGNTAHTILQGRITRAQLPGAVVDAHFSAIDARQGCVDQFLIFGRFCCGMAPMGGVIRVLSFSLVAGSQDYAGQAGA
jgi:hypothetical protein